MANATISTITPLADAGLTDKEIRLLASAWLSSSSTDLDIDKFAAVAGYPSAANARKRLGEAKSKARAKVFGPSGSAGGSVSAGDSAGEGNAPSTPKTPKKTPKVPKKTPKPAPKRKSTASADTCVGSDESPPKRGRTLQREDDAEAPQETEESAAPSEVPSESTGAKVV
ncbi:hypothetical protein F503_03814 [Ophiostoma piceae UAMH 11346]|uniref:Uncharacterized protein n=1 Tax=Ophiostoma piceae (strain UAMH 11346) TaxID=1262450 RepID=S3BVH6_OPHP1|nr:hypothetical protein F503_03814 [Ophiostoma piceae UAMH 11346]